MSRTLSEYLDDSPDCSVVADVLLRQEEDDDDEEEEDEDEEDGGGDVDDDEEEDDEGYSQWGTVISVGNGRMNGEESSVSWDPWRAACIR